MTKASLKARSANNDPGKFGYMFDGVPALHVGDDALADLASAMLDDDPDGAYGDNPAIPAGFTYLGQFIDHDITLDLTPLAVQGQDPLSIQNFRTPALDLDSLYGDGPAASPHLYKKKGNEPGPELMIGKAEASFDPGAGQLAESDHDLPRDPADGKALIGDPRNDENLAVAQTHLAFLKFHNAVVAWLKDNRYKGDLFAEARRLTTWHYQWIVLYDYAGRMTEPGLIDKIRHQGRQHYRFPVRPYMPAEFSAAAFRLGHPQVRENYSHNRIFREGGLAPGGLQQLFYFSNLSGGIVGDRATDGSVTKAQFLLPNANPAQFPDPMKTLPSNWAIDWRRFYDMSTPPADGFALNASRLINPKLTPTLHTLPGHPPGSREGMLPFRNLRRGVQLELPSGQDVATKMGVPQLNPNDIGTGPDGAAAASHDLLYHTPLWYYILKEAEVIHLGQRLGPVGELIVAETLLGMVHGDHKSFMWLRSNWKPELPRADSDTFTMVDLLNFVDDINPVG